MRQLRITSFGPQRSWVRPGASVTVRLDIVAAEQAAAELTLQLTDLDRTVAMLRRRVQLKAGASGHAFTVQLPPVSRHGYGLTIRVATADATVTASSAVEALDGWWQSPRHAAITDYRERDETAADMRELVRWHVTVAQHYDWMWRHYRYRPPDGSGTFADSLGRRVSHDALRAGIDAGHEVGTASLAYGSVYGAEAEHVERFPDDRVFNERGEPLSLGDTFFINDIRPGTPWRQRLLGEYRDAIGEFGFDGIHMDSYGRPHSAVAADGEVIDFAALFPGLIREASEEVAAARQDARVLFNCVDGFPLAAVAGAPTTCLYLELWPPDRAFADVVRWVSRAKELAGDRQVVIAAYAASLLERPSPERRREAFEAVVLLGTVIMAAGAYHHTLAAGDRLLVEGYYPAAVPLLAPERRELQALWRFSARYVHLLSAPGRLRLDTAELSLRDAAGRQVPTSTQPQAGSIWATATESPNGSRVLHLVDLRGQPDNDWDSPKRRPSRSTGLRLEWPSLRSPVVASPWRLQAAATPLRWTPGARSRSRGRSWELPSFRRWLMVAD